MNLENALCTCPDGGNVTVPEQTFLSPAVSQFCRAHKAESHAWMLNKKRNINLLREV